MATGLRPIYPLKINLLKINGASITYIDEDQKRPLTLTRLNLEADNIRNIHVPDKVYPSNFHLETDVFGSGHGSVDGRANFLAEPTPAVKAALSSPRSHWVLRTGGGPTLGCLRSSPVVPESG